MSISEGFNLLQKRVGYLRDLDFCNIREKEVLENWIGCVSCATGRGEIIYDEGLTFAKVIFILRADAFVLTEQPKSWKEGTANQQCFYVVSDDLDRIVLLANKFLDDNPQYFRTFTDEYGNVYGIKEK